ncbi:MAG: hypothetical protein DSZ04_02965 [Sulfurimonas sp.]|nr:MAG: hypothetical protein DSZ04_02965 [Sulfurimonas sp.]
MTKRKQYIASGTIFEELPEHRKVKGKQAYINALCALFVRATLMNTEAGEDWQKDRIWRDHINFYGPILSEVMGAEAYENWIETGEREVRPNIWVKDL